MSRAFTAPGGASLCAPARRAGVRSARRATAALPARAAMVTVTFTPADGGESIVSEVTKASVLREVALGEKVALYQGMNKLLNCGGIGNCGTCRVNVEQGAELLSPRTDVETKKLQGKPETNRLACQCLVGGDDAPEGAEVRVTTAPPVSGAFVTCEERGATSFVSSSRIITSRRSTLFSARIRRRRSPPAARRRRAPGVGSRNSRLFRWIRASGTTRPWRA